MNEAGIGQFFIGVDVTDCIFPRRNISSNIQFAVVVMRGMIKSESLLNEFINMVIFTYMYITRSLGALRAPTSSLRPFGPALGP